MTSNNNNATNNSGLPNYLVYNLKEYKSRLASATAAVKTSEACNRLVYFALNEQDPMCWKVRADGSVMTDTEFAVHKKEAREVLKHHQQHKNHQETPQQPQPQQQQQQQRPPTLQRRLSSARNLFGSLRSRRNSTTAKLNTNNTNSNNSNSSNNSSSNNSNSNNSSSSNSNTVNFAELPHDVLVSIFSMLDLLSFSAAHETCKTWHKASTHESFSSMLQQLPRLPRNPKWKLIDYRNPFVKETQA